MEDRYDVVVVGAATQARSRWDAVRLSAAQREDVPDTRMTEFRWMTGRERHLSSTEAVQDEFAAAEPFSRGRAT
jgi:hypothetical protein